MTTDRFRVKSEYSSGRYWIVEQTPGGEVQHEAVYHTAQDVYDAIKQLNKK